MAKAKKQSTTPDWWKNRIVKYGEQAANQFLAHELNARRHPGKQRDALRGSLNAVGWVAPVIVSAKTGKILDGHARVEEALSQGEESPVPFVEVDVSENEERTILATFDPITGLATYEREALDALLREVDTGEAALQEMLSELAAREGLYLDEAGAMGDPSDAEPQIDRAAELNKKWKVKPGDLWLIGSHRLLCGDSTNAEDVARVMGGEKAKLMNTDPPYGDSWVQKARDMQKHGYGHSHAVLHGEIESDDKTGDELKAFLDAFLAAAKQAGDAPFPAYVWHRAKRMLFEQALMDAGYHVHQPVIWVKPGFVIGRLHYHPRCEWALHGWLKGNGICPFYGERNQSDVWDVSRENDKIHPTQKPLKLFETPILNHTKAGEVVYEPFAGSGSQLVAAQNLNRRCYGIEISPDYCAVILERMSQAFPDLEIKRDA